MNLKHDKEKVLITGLNLFCQKGYSNLGIDEICKTTGMTKGAFYNSFKSKEQFLLEAISAYSEQNIKRIEKKLQPDNHLSALERLEQFYIQMLEAQPKNNFSGCFINNMMSELGFINDNVGALTAQEFDKFIDAITPTVAEAQKKNELINTIPARAITELLHATFYGILTRIKSSRDYPQGIATFNLLLNNLKTNYK
jgi:TetR/AcrR family transcriptional repressor of nem operon